MKFNRILLPVLLVLSSSVIYSSQEALTQFAASASQATQALPGLASLMNQLKDALVNKNYGQVAEIAKTAQEGQGLIPSSLTSFFSNGIGSLTSSLTSQLKNTIPDSLIEKGGMIGSLLKTFRDKSVEQLSKTADTTKSVGQLSQLQISDPAKFAQDLKALVENGSLKPSALGKIASQTSSLQNTLGSMTQAISTATQGGLFENLKNLVAKFTSTGAATPSFGDIRSLMSGLGGLQSLFSTVSSTSSAGSGFLGSMVSSFGPALLNQVSPSLASTLAPALQMLTASQGGWLSRAFNWLTGR
jgi:hypothetical protein